VSARTKPTARVRLKAPLRAGRRLALRAVPPSRRIKGLGGAKGRGLLQARKLVAPLFQLPIVLTSASGLRLRITGDPVDEQIAQALTGPRRDEYFPAWPTGTPSEPCILDIGAHHGLYAAAALHEYAGARIICVEPSAEALDALRANLRLNGFSSRARIVNVALAPESGEGLLQHAPDGSWGYSLYEDAATSDGAEVVSLAPLRDVLAGECPQIVKCNAEGAEFTLLEQLETATVRPELMIVMVHPQFGELDKLLRRAQVMGYSVSQVGTAHRPCFHMWRIDRGSS
jgi:FkbM family methyltransferase